MILVVAEHRADELNRATWETIAAAQRLARHRGGSSIILLLPGRAGRAAEDLAAAGIGEVLVLDDAALNAYTADGYVQALSAVVTTRSPAFVVLPHTYQARDFVPALAARLARPLVTDVTGIAGAADATTFLRPMFQGKLTAEVRPADGTPCFVTFQIGAFRADAECDLPDEAISFIIAKFLAMKGIASERATSQ